MTTLFSKNNLRTTSIFSKIIVLALITMFSFPVLSQEFGQQPIYKNLESGIINPITATVDVGVVQFKIDNFNAELAKIVVSEFKKYSGDIVNCGYSVVDSKVIVSYQNDIYPNYLLAILDRVNIHGYYDLNGVETRYVKDGKSGFIR